MQCLLNLLFLLIIPGRWCLAKANYQNDILNTCFKKQIKGLWVVL